MTLKSGLEPKILERIKNLKTSTTKEKVFSNDVSIGAGFRNSVKRAKAGLKLAFTMERNFKIELIVGILTIILGFVFQLNYIEWSIIVGIIFVVLIAELANTSIELLVNLNTGREFKIMAMRAKDVSAGMVLMSTIAAVIIGVIIFGSKII